MKLIAALTLLVAAAPSWAAEIYTFETLPPSGQILGAPGQTIGWGYQLTNESSSQWLVTSGLATEPFAFGTPQALFDFPILAPGASVIVPFDATTLTGLFAITWDLTAPVGANETGTFLLNAEWWDGDPFGNGQLVSAASPTTRGYSAVVTPEPATAALMAMALVGGAFLVRRQRS